MAPIFGPIGLVKHRVGETLDLAEVRRLAREGMSLNRAANFLGVHWTTLDKLCLKVWIEFPRRYGTYGYQGIRQ